MNEQVLGIATPDGEMETFLAMPASGGPFPAVVLFMDIWGMREQLREVARTVAAEGFACAAPGLYYREGDACFEQRDADGRSRSISALAAEDRQRMLDYAGHLTDEMVIADTGTLMAALRGVEGVKRGYAGSFGYCMGGRHALRVAAAMSGLFRATASFHGTYLVTDGPDSPHRLAPQIQGEVYLGYGGNDPYTPPETVAALAAAFDGVPAKMQQRVHPGCEHGYAIPDRDVYDEAATRQDWEATLAMFRRML